MGGPRFPAGGRAARDEVLAGVVEGDSRGCEPQSPSPAAQAQLPYAVAMRKAGGSLDSYRHLNLATVAQQPLPGLSVPVHWTFSADGNVVLFLYGDGSTKLSLYALDLITGSRRLLAGSDASEVRTPEEELRQERQRVRWEGITDYQLVATPEGPRLLIPHGGSISVMDPETGVSAEITGVRGMTGIEDPQLLSDGHHLVFVHDGKVGVATLPDGPVTWLTEGALDGLTFGLAEYVAQEELGRSHGYWVSPNNAWVAFEEADSRDIPPYPIVHWGGPEWSVETHRYPFAGRPNARVRLGIVPLHGGSVRWLDLADGRSDEEYYLARVVWTPEGRLLVGVLARDHRTLSWYLYDLDRDRSTLLWREESDTWVNLPDDPTVLRTGEVLTTTEQDGYRHLWLFSVDGGLGRQITHGAFVISAVVSLDEAARVAYVMATRESPLERHLYAVSLDTGHMHQMTVGAGVHSVAMSPDHRHWVDQHSALEHAPVTRVRDREGGLVATLHDPGIDAETLELRPPRIVNLPASDGTLLYGALYEPEPASDGKRPVVLSVYGGPHAQTVTRSWGMTVDLQAQYLAAQGILVFKLDNRGMYGRGHAFETPLYRRFGTVELQDQIQGVRWLVEHEGADPKRVGIYGWSYGGFMTLTALVKAPEIFSVGVAGAPVTDFAFYDTAYTERYMGTPEDNPDGYREASIMTHIHQLSSPLLIVHGLIDENVHFRHTARLIQTLVEAEKDFEILMLPESRHGPRGQAYQLAVAARRTRFLVDHLLGGPA